MNSRNKEVPDSSRGGCFLFGGSLGSSLAREALCHHVGFLHCAIVGALTSVLKLKHDNPSACIPGLSFSVRNGGDGCSASDLLHFFAFWHWYLGL